MVTVLLTAVALVLAVAIVGLVVWETRHRRSDIVRAWNPSTCPGRVGGGLGVLHGGRISDRLGPEEPEAVVLLHGLGATADYFGDVYEGVARERRLVMPDLLGFGRSLDERRERFDLDAHVTALENVLDSIGLGTARLAIGAHSMGSAIALAFARRHPDRVTKVLLWSPPVLAARPLDEGDDTSTDGLRDHAGPMTRLFLLDTEWAHRICRWSCANRPLAGWVAAALAPRFPVPISRRSVLHTWPAYVGSLRSLVLDADWDELFATEVPVVVVRGADDEIGDLGELTRVARRADVHHVIDADHHVALTHPHLLFDLLDL